MLPYKQASKSAVQIRHKLALHFDKTNHQSVDQKCCGAVWCKEVDWGLRRELPGKSWAYKEQLKLFTCIKLLYMPHTPSLSYHGRYLARSLHLLGLI